MRISTPFRPVPPTTAVNGCSETVRGDDAPHGAFLRRLLAESDAETTAMRHRFGPKRRSNPRDGEKARWRRRLAVAHRCTGVAHPVHSPAREWCHEPLRRFGGRDIPARDPATFHDRSAAFRTQCARCHSLGASRDQLDPLQGGGDDGVDKIPRTRYTWSLLRRICVCAGHGPWARGRTAAGLRCVKPNEPERSAEINELAIRASAKAGHCPRQS